MSSLSHIDPKKGPQMVDVGGKVATQREAVARARVAMSSETLRAVVESRTPKGDVLSTARIAGIMAAKRTPELIPLCHPLPLTYVGVELTPNMAKSSIEIEATVRTTAPTGVEMEALTAVSVAALTVYDMCKSLGKAMRIQDVRLVRKTGGKSGPVLLED